MENERQTREERFTRLFDSHYPAVRAYAWRRGRDSADDVVADTFTIAWQRLDTLPNDPLPWLLAVARNVHLNAMRSDRRRRERETRCAQTDATPSFIGAIEARSSLREAFERLHEDDREILLLAAWESLDRAALAKVLGCSKSAARVRLYRARRRLDAALADAAARPCILPADRKGGLLDEC